MWGIILLISLGLLALLIVANVVLSIVKKRKALNNKKGENNDGHC